MERWWQPSLFGSGGPVSFRTLTGLLGCVDLGAGAWVALFPSWVVGHDVLFEELIGVVPWRAERRQMYHREVEVPRLVAHYRADQRPPHARVAEAGRLLGDYFRHDPAGPFRSVGLCLYRDGNDSVAWHGDRIGRGVAPTLVAIVSLGCRRRLLLRPKGGGRSLHYDLGEGDLMVMGGLCQHSWEHALPKRTRVTGPRISVQFRTAATLVPPPNR